MNIWSTTKVHQAIFISLQIIFHFISVDLANYFKVVREVLSLEHVFGDIIKNLSESNRGILIMNFDSDAKVVNLIISRFSLRLFHKEFRIRL